MDNKKYIDKIFSSLIRSTRFYPDKREVSSPFHNEDDIIPSYAFFSSYCENQFGLTEEEIKYVFKQYREIIKNKIDSGE